MEKKNLMQRTIFIYNMSAVRHTMLNNHWQKTIMYNNWRSQVLSIVFWKSTLAHNQCQKRPICYMGEPRQNSRSGDALIVQTSHVLWSHFHSTQDRDADVFRGHDSKPGLVIGVIISPAFLFKNDELQPLPQNVNTTAKQITTFIFFTADIKTRLRQSGKNTHTRKRKTWRALI